MKIEIKDERIEQVLPCALENLKVEVVESSPQVFKVLEDEKVVEKTLEVVEPAYQTTLKDLDADISNLEERIATTQTQLAYAQAELTKKQAMRVDLLALVEPAHTDLMAAVAVKEAELAEPVEVPIEKP